MTWPWVFVTGLLVVVSAAVVGYWWPVKPLSGKRTIKLAGTQRYLALPAVRLGIARGRWFAVLGLVAAVVIGLGATIVAARPADQHLVRREVSNRDVVLCLDVSGSMEETAVDLANAYRAMVGGFNGDRVALSIFNARSVSVFPLTDEYEFLEEKLAEIATWLGEPIDWENDASILPWLGVIDWEGEYSSLISDGLANCIDMFDRPEETRSRSVVLSTDNEYNGEPLVTMDQAVAMARQAGVKVYAINPYAKELPGEARELAEAATATGGAFFEAYDSATVNQVVQQISAQQATSIQLPPRRIVTDRPTFGAVILGLGGLGLALVAAPWTWFSRRKAGHDV